MKLKKWKESNTHKIFTLCDEHLTKIVFLTWLHPMGVGYFKKKIRE